VYGLINKAIEGLLRSEFGDDAWEKVRVAAHIPDEPFLAMEPYDDRVTYALVAAAEATLERPAAEVLRAFGHYWVRYTAEVGYGGMMASAGGTFPEFLTNLDGLHTRVQLAFPELRPPSFAVSEVVAAGASGTLTLDYRSERLGLAPLVLGLLEGLGLRFGLAVTATYESHTAPTGRPFDRFRVAWMPAVSPPP